MGTPNSGEGQKIQCSVLGYWIWLLNATLQQSCFLLDDLQKLKPTVTPVKPVHNSGPLFEPSYQSYFDLVMSHNVFTLCYVCCKHVKCVIFIMRYNLKFRDYYGITYWQPKCFCYIVCRCFLVNVYWLDLVRDLSLKCR